MRPERIDWSRVLQGDPAERQSGIETAEAFLERATVELQPLYLPDEIIATVRTAGCTVRGSRYFRDLYSETATPEERIKSVFTGSVAHGRADLARDAYALLDHSDETSSDLIKRLDTSIRNERQQGSFVRLERLENAARALGKPLPRRVLGRFATAVAISAR